MADRQISNLDPATGVTPTDLFVLEQNSTAKKLTGQQLETWLLSFAESLGGITSITWTTSGTSGNGQYHNATIHYANGSTSTFSIRDGVKGNTGSQTYVYIRYAASDPRQEAQDITTEPDNWIGIHVGTETTAPTLVSDYSWFEWKGEKGDTGDPSTATALTSYMESTSGTEIPTGTWSTIIPSVSQGNYLWTRTVLTFNDGTGNTFYSVARQGVDGEGQVDELASNFADEFSDSSQYAVGDLVLYNRHMYMCIEAISVPAAFDGTQWQEVSVEDVANDAKPRVFTANVSAATNATIMTITDDWITDDTIVLSCQFTTRSYVTSNVSWASTAGSIVFTGSASASTTATVILAKKGN